MIKYALLLIAIAGATAADPIFYASSANTWSLPVELTARLHVEGSFSRDYTGGSADYGFGLSVDVPGATLPPGAVVLSDILFVSFDASVTNWSENIETVPIDPAKPYTPWIFRGGWFWAVTCPYGDYYLCAYNQSNQVVVSPPFPDEVYGSFQIFWRSPDGPGADSGYNAISDAYITTDYMLTVRADRFVEYSLPTPEPASAVVLGAGLLCLGVLRRRRALQ